MFEVFDQKVWKSAIIAREHALYRDIKSKVIAVFSQEANGIETS
jgi:hypothetical protein